MSCFSFCKVYSHFYPLLYVAKNSNLDVHQGVNLALKVGMISFELFLLINCLTFKVVDNLYDKKIKKKIWTLINLPKGMVVFKR